MNRPDAILSPYCFVPKQLLLKTSCLYWWHSSNIVCNLFILHVRLSVCRAACLSVCLSVCFFLSPSLLVYLFYTDEWMTRLNPIVLYLWLPLPIWSCQLPTPISTVFLSLYLSILLYLYLSILISLSLSLSSRPLPNLPLPHVLNARCRHGEVTSIFGNVNEGRCKSEMASRERPVCAIPFTLP